MVEAKREYREGGGKGQNQPIPRELSTIDSLLLVQLHSLY